MTTDIEKLKELEATATPGPWKQHLVDDTCVIDARGEPVCNTWPEGGEDDDIDFASDTEQRERDAAFIVAMRNALPALPDLLASLASKDAEIERLKAVIRDTLWMARRYADGRSTYAVHMYNDAARVALADGAIDQKHAETIWAADAMGPEYGKLSQEEHDQAVAARTKFEQLRAEGVRHAAESAEFRLTAALAALESIEIYGSDTLSGRTQPDAATYKDWLIEGIREMRDRARKARATLAKLNALEGNDDGK